MREVRAVHAPFLQNWSLVEPGIPRPRGELAARCCVAVELRKRSESSIDVDVGLVLVEVVGGAQVHRGRAAAALLRRLEDDRVGDLRHLFEIATCWTK